MVEEDGIGDAAVVVGYGCCLEGYGTEELFLVGEADDSKALLDGSSYSCSVGADVAE